MKKIILLVVMLNTTTMFSQEYPFLTDFLLVGSILGSAVATVEYYELKEADRKLIKDINSFNAKYSKRAIYLVGASIILAGEINREIDDAQRRYHLLKGKNSSLPFFIYSKKRHNTQTLELINEMLDNLQNELKKQNPRGVALYGEKINLHQNTMESLSNIHRLMDSVEDKIEQSKVLHAFINR